MRTCEECAGVDWVQVVDKRHPENYTVRPCSRCLPQAHDKWLHRGYQGRWNSEPEKPSEHGAISMATSLAEARAHLKSL